MSSDDFHYFSDKNPESGDSTPSTTKKTPWDRRHELGWFHALIRTIQSLIGEPRTFFKRLSPGTEFGSDLIYGVILSVIGSLPNYLWQNIFRLYQFPGENPEAVGLTLLFTLGGLLFFLIVAPIGALVWIFTGAGILHLILMLVGGANRTFTATVKTVCYAQTANLANFIPFIGPLLGMVWFFYLEIVGLSVLHRISTNTAAIAALTPIALFILCCLLFCLGIFALVMMAGQSSGFWEAFREGLEQARSREVMLFILFLKTKWTLNKKY